MNIALNVAIYIKCDKNYWNFLLFILLKILSFSVLGIISVVYYMYSIECERTQQSQRLYMFFKKSELDCNITELDSTNRNHFWFLIIPLQISDTV